MIKTLLHTDDSRATLIIRLMVGAVFLSEGIQKFLFAGQLGAGRFAKIGLPSPDILGPLVGTFEILCGALILLGLLTRLAAIPAMIIMITAIITTKLPMLSEKGFWHMLHESRTDWAMLLGSIFLAIRGAGKLSLDKLVLRKQEAEKS